MRKLKASALQYVIIISIIAVLLCGLFIISVYNGGRIIDDKAILSRLESDVKSAITVYLANANNFQVSSSGSAEKAPDDIELHETNWGIYRIVTARASHNYLNLQKTYLVGEDISQNPVIALYVPNNTLYVSASGKTIIKGDCYLPANGIRPDYSGINGFVGDSLPYGKVFKSDDRLPEIDEDVLKNAFVYTVSDSIKQNVSIDVLEDSKPLSNSFSKPTIVFDSKEDVTLTCPVISGNIVVKSASIIRVSSSCKLYDVILVAPIVVLEQGFNGNVQVFATRSITVNQDSKILYPSSLVVLGSETSSEESRFIQLKENTVFCGTIVLQTKEYSTNMSKIKLDEKSVVYGFVYTNTKTEIAGAVYGCIYTNKFYMETPSRITENLLHNVIIDARKLPRDFSRAMIFKQKNKLRVVNLLQ